MSSRSILIVSMVACCGTSFVSRFLWFKDDNLTGQFLCGAAGLAVAFFVYMAFNRCFLKRLFLRPVRGLDSLEVVERTLRRGGGGQFVRIQRELPVGPIVYVLYMDLDECGSTRSIPLTMTITGSLDLRGGTRLDCSIPRAFDPPTLAGATVLETLVGRMGAVILTEAVTNGWLLKPVIPGGRIVLEGVPVELPEVRPIDDLVRSVRHALNMRGWNVTALKIRIDSPELSQETGVVFVESEVA